jgi:glyoxylase-like metal-dependent hydrolase (beta-lactamase superfamily II)
VSDWDKAGAFAVADGVHRIPLPLPGDGLRAVNVYALADGDGLTLVDSGWALTEARERLEAALASIGHDLGGVRRFLVTHVHRDHYTLAVTLRRLFGSRIALGEGERSSLDVIMSLRARQANPHRAQLIRAGGRRLADRLWPPAGPARDAEQDIADWERPDEWLDAAADVKVGARTLQVIPTPGHTRGHLVFADSDRRLLFAGDHVLPHITPSIGFEADRPELPLGDYLASLRLVRSLPDMRLLPAHGPVADSVHARIDELIAHHDRRLDEAAETVDHGAVTAYDAAQLLTWTRRGRRFGELDPFNQLLAVMVTGAHLDVLVRQGRLRATVTGGVVTYAAG